MNAPDSEPSPVVETTLGRLRGLTDRGAHAFRGIRYAEDTGGANRFRPPRTPAAWAGVRDAVDFGASAPQNVEKQSSDPFYAWYAAIRPTSEDCLFLNVFTPGLDDRRRPVMVWIHGGGWRAFSGTAPGFDGTALARAQDVVVVTLNHRLSVLGFLRIDDGDETFADAGNAGLLDIVAALRWVRDNAPAFGGNPGNVTLFGQSGGGSKIAALMAMPAASGLFHKAIVQSSSGGLFLNDAETAARQSAELAAALGLSSLRGRDLQDLPVDRIVDAVPKVAGPFVGVVDGRHFDRHPFDPTAPALSRDVPLLAGCTATEATYYLRTNPRNFALEQADVQRRLMRFLELGEGEVDRLIEGYRDAYPGADASRILALVASDYLFRRNTEAIARRQAATASAPVFSYLFARPTPVEGGVLGAPHTTEVPFIFGTTDAARAHVGDGPDIVPMTDLMMNFWASFARHGRPSHPSAPAWPVYRPEDRATMVLDVACRIESDPGGVARALLDPLPFYGYGRSREGFVRD